MTPFRLTLAAFALLFTFTSYSLAASSVVITEFMASNASTNVLVDEDRETSDWIEICNVGETPVNLENWALTDAPGNLTQWRFPATNLNAGAYMVIFASGKDRRIPGRPLHTNFRLTGSGEFLALVEADGTTIAFDFGEKFAPQVPNISYGIVPATEVRPLVASNSPVRVLVPSDASLSNSWTAAAMNDSSWLAGTNGVGFERIQEGMEIFRPLIATDIGARMSNENATAFIRLPFVVEDPTKLSGLRLRVRYDDGFVAYIDGVMAAQANAPIGGVVADSQAEFSGVQGQAGWYYGYYNKTLDTVAGYQAADFIQFSANYWISGIWDWPAGNPPWTAVDATGGHPNGSNNGNVHWAIRRWVSDVTGTVVAHIRLAKSNPNCGNGTTGRILVNGVQQYAQSIAAANSTGLTADVTLTNVMAGDPVDFVIDSVGTTASDEDSCDGTIFTVQLEYIVPALAWNSGAVTNRAGADGLQYQEFDLYSMIPWLSTGTNMLAIQGLNSHATNSDFFVQAELDGVFTTSLTSALKRYFTQPTPGTVNNVGVADLGPIITEPTHSPAMPLDYQDLFVTARISPAFAPVASNSLTYVIMYGAETTVPMLDDGQHGDGVAGDGVYGATIPANLSTNGEMIRWFITAKDIENRVSRWPIYPDPNDSPRYLGTVVADPSILTPLPVFHWFIQSPTAADSDAGTRVSVFYEGEFYDNVLMNLHGQSSRDFPKKSYDIGFNSGYRFRYAADKDPVSDLNFMTTYPDKAHMRNILAYETYRDAGSPYHWVLPARVQKNSQFWGTVHLMENGDAEYVVRNGRDINGALYKMYNDFTSSPAHAVINSGVAEKKTRKYEGNADLLALLNGVLQNGTTGTGENERRYVYDNVNIPQVVNYMAARVITGDQDCCHKNYYLYRDTMGTGEWEAWPWDVDLSFGRRWISSLTYYDDAMVVDTSMVTGQNNSLFAAIGNTAEMRQMYWRRFRTLMDEFIQPPGTPVAGQKIERRVDELVGLLSLDANRDLLLQGTWCCGAKGPFTQATISQPSSWQTIEQAADLLKSGYMTPRRVFLYSNKIVSAGGEIPGPQPPNTGIGIHRIEYNPASGNQAQEFILLTNGNNFAVDISGWRLSGAVDFTFQPGTVIPSNRVVYVSPDVKAFRARAISPKGNEAVFVQGPYKGQLSARGETVLLRNHLGALIATNAYSGAPSVIQQFLRITEIMYHPASLPGNTNQADAFEYIELKNISPTVTLDLRGVSFINGVSFNFTGSAVTNLAPGQRVLVVADLAAFAARYGSGLTVAGQYAPYSLENRGERIQLVDAGGEDVLDFSYDNAWHPITDGAGFSLVAVDENAEPDAWNRKSQWRPSGQVHGAPGAADAAAPSIAPVLITEALTRTEAPPPTDSIELHNPTASPVNIGGWFLTDDFNTPRKYRIPDGTTIGAGGYVVFDESHFNPTPGLPPSFALSADGDEVYLFSGDATTNLTGYYHGFTFGAADDGVTFGRVVTSDGKQHFAVQATPTLGTNNAGPRVGPIVISELMYHPPEFLSGEDNTLDEYIELRNLTASPAPLYSESLPGIVWKLTGGVDFDFPADAVLPAGGYGLVVNFNPTNAAQLAAFRTRYNVAETTPIFGPYGGKLNNDGDDIELKRPSLLQPLGTLAYVRVDEVEFKDNAPWPGGADGFGLSLQRVTASGFGNEPTNWVAALPTAAAAPPAAGQPPSIAAQPAAQTVVAYSAATLSVAAAGAEPLRYQWRRNGVNLPGANAQSLAFSSFQTQDAGSYEVVVYNDFGSATSTNVILEVVLPVSIMVQPQPVSKFPRQAATFAVQGFSSWPIAYQWHRNGTAISGATNSSYTLPSVEPPDAGQFSVLLTDRVGSNLSLPAALEVIAHPVFTVEPTNRVVALAATGGSSNITLSCTATSSTAIAYQWFFNDAPVANATNTLFTKTMTLADSGNYSVRATDGYGSTTSSNAYILVSQRPAFVVNPASRTNLSGEDAVFFASASGSEPMTFQWRRGSGFYTNGIVQSVGTNSTLIMTNVSYLNDNDRISVVVANPAHPVGQLSGAATLRVEYAPVVTVQPTNNHVVRGTNVTLYASYRVNPTNSGYGWFLNETNLLRWVANVAAATPQAVTLTVTNVQETNEGIYTLVVTNKYGLTASTGAVLNLRRPPSILEQPQSLAVAPGANAAFSLVVTGAPPFSYIWRWHGTNLAGAADAPTLELTGVQAGQTGPYSVVVTNALGAVTSAVAVLTVIGVVDTDGDGMPDEWELANGLNPNNPNDGALDKDLDGSSNADEYLAGTDPGNPQSYLKIEAAGQEGSGIVLGFLAVSNRAYAVYYRENVGQTTWTKLLPEVAAAPTNRVIRLTNAPLGTIERYYRLQTPGAP